MSTEVKSGGTVASHGLLWPVCYFPFRNCMFACLHVINVIYLVPNKTVKKKKKKNDRKPRWRLSPAGLDYQPLLKSEPSLI